MSSSRITLKSQMSSPDLETRVTSVLNPVRSRDDRALSSASLSAPRSSIAATAMSPLIPE